MIRLTSSETFSETETLCAVVDTETAQARELLSKTCFSEFPFLCSLGECSVRPAAPSGFFHKTTQKQAYILWHKFNFFVLAHDI